MALEFINPFLVDGPILHLLPESTRMFSGVINWVLVPEMSELQCNRKLKMQFT